MVEISSNFNVHDGIQASPIKLGGQSYVIWVAGVDDIESLKEVVWNLLFLF